MFPVYTRIMLRHVLRRPFQSMMFVIGVMIGVAMMVAIDMANHSATRAFELSTDTVAGRATHQIFGSPAGIQESVYVEIRRDIGWKNAAPIVEDYVTAPDLDERPLRLLGIDPLAELPFRNYLTADDQESLDSIAVGRFLIEPDAVLIGENLAQEYGLEPGDTLLVYYADRARELNIVAVLRPADEFAARALSGLIIADISTAQEVLGKSGVLSRIDLLIREDVPEDLAALDAISAILPPGLTLEVPRVRRESLKQITGAFQLNLTALSLLALIVGMFLIYNTVTFSVVQRRTVLATLRSLGVTRGGVFRIVLGEALLLGGLGAVLGLFLGVVLGRGAVVMVTQSINDLFFTTSVRTVEVAPLTLIKGLVVGIGAALVAAAMPAYEATFTPPAGASRRSEIESRLRRLVPLASGGGVALVAVGGLLLFVPNLLVSLVSLFMILIGLAFLTPAATIYAMRIVRPACGIAGGVVGRIAPQSIIRNLSRTSIAIAALMVATSMIVGVTVMVGSFRITVQDWLQTTLRADIFISPPIRTFSEQTAVLEPDVLEIIEGTEGVGKIYFVRNVNLSIHGDSVPVYANAVASDISDGQRNFLRLRRGYDHASAWEMLLSGDAVFMTDSFAHNRGLTWSDDLEILLVTEDGPLPFQVLGIHQDFSTGQGNIVLGINTYRRHWNDMSITSAAADIQPGTDIETVIKNLEVALAGRELVVQSNRQLFESALEVFDRTFLITSALNLLATLVAFVGVLSALMSLQIERRREIGIMRSNGLTRGQLWRLTIWETGLMGMMAGLLAMPTGLILAAVLTYIINQRSFGWTLAMNLRAEFFVQAFLVALVAALIAGLYPAYTMGRVVPAQALRAE